MLKSLFLIHHKDVVKEDERERRKENERNPKRIVRDEKEKENDENFEMVEKVISHVIRVILLKNILQSLSNKSFGRHFTTILQHPYCVAKGKKFPGCV